MHRQGPGRGSRSVTDVRALLCAGPDLDRKDRGADPRAQRKLHHRHRDSQYAAGRSRVGFHGFFLPRGADRIRHYEQDFHEPGETPDGGLHYGPVRLTLFERIERFERFKKLGRLSGSTEEKIPVEHTDRRFEEDLKKLREDILTMAGLVEDQIQKAVRTLVDRDSPLAETIIQRDHEVNRLDVEIDDLCIRLLALHQPAARDLRFITTALKITTDLERIGDMAVNICERALELNREPQLKPYIDIPRMAQISQRMIRESLDAYVREDTDLALKVCKDDQQVDDLNSQVFRETISFMIGDPQTINRAMKISSISKYLERIADHATNIAEVGVFLVKGKRIRHLKELPQSI